ncbi:MAG TPA: PDZ domain-containing protein [Jiangellaceae bacterium]
MTRRTATLAFAGAILVVLVAVAALLPVPYVVYSPGPMENALGDDVISVAGAETFETDGVLNLTTVGMTPADVRLDLLTALQAWVDPDRALVPRDLIYGPDETAEEVREENARFMRRSQDSAKAAALRELGYDVPETVLIDMVVDGSPADGTLEPGDIVEEVDGEPVTTPQDVVDAVRAHEPGETVEVVVRRGGESMTLTVDTVESEEGHAQVGAGVGVGYEFPVQIEVNINDRIGGPSAGMIFALAIYDTLTPGALLEDLRVAGTGEITDDGEVGAIGGIQQKIAAAAHDDIELFLAPAPNCDDVVGARNGDMQVVSIETLDDAIEAVEAAAAGDTQSLPSCSLS